MKNLLFAALTLCAIVLYSCGSSCSLEDLTKDTTGITDLAYLNGDTTKTACDAYAAELQSIVDDYGDCEEADVKVLVDSFKTQLANLDCQ